MTNTNQTEANTQGVFNVGKLVDMQWKLGVSMSSDACKNLNSPFVAMTMTVAESSGTTSTKSFELSLSQFKDFHKQMKEMAVVMETL